MIWSLCLCRNDKIFNDKSTSLMQVIYKYTGTLRLWSSLQRVENRDLFTEVCTRLEATARNTFTQHGWQHDLRIGPPMILALYRYTFFFVFRLPILFSLVVRTLLAVCILVMQRPGVILKPFK